MGKIKAKTKQLKQRYQEYRRFKPLCKHLVPGERRRPLAAVRTFKREILTLKERTECYVNRYNPRPIRIETNKINVKKRLEEAGVPVPRTIATFEKKRELPDFDRILRESGVRSFVIKPNSSCGGRGIVIIRNTVGKRYLTIRNRRVNPIALQKYLRKILKGGFTNISRDKILVEERIEPHVKLRALFTQGFIGLPDVRVIVFRGFPVMAMLRLPVTASAGRANLHRGSVGCGVDLATGTITYAIYKGKPTTIHPETEQPLIGFTLPHWREVLETATAAQLVSGLGYTGVDIPIDDGGPLVLEINKRPGLEIQNANQAGLRRRLHWIEGQYRVRPNWKAAERELLAEYQVRRFKPSDRGKNTRQRDDAAEDKNSDADNDNAPNGNVSTGIGGPEREKDAASGRHHHALSSQCVLSTPTATPSLSGIAGEGAAASSTSVAPSYRTAYDHRGDAAKHNLDDAVGTGADHWSAVMSQYGARDTDTDTNTDPYGWLDQHFRPVPLYPLDPADDPAPAKRIGAEDGAEGMVGDELIEVDLRTITEPDTDPDADTDTDTEDWSHDAACRQLTVEERVDIAIQWDQQNWRTPAEAQRSDDGASDEERAVEE